MMAIKIPLVIFQIVPNFFRQTAHEITYNNFEISLVVFMPNNTTNHALRITYTNTCLIYNKDRDFSPLLVYHLHDLLGRLWIKPRYICWSTFRKKKHPKRSNQPICPLEESLRRSSSSWWWHVSNLVHYLFLNFNKNFFMLCVWAETECSHFHLLGKRLF